jgi:uncharacterized membrane protein
MEPEAKEVSPTGQVVGLSALLAKAPPSVMYALGSLLAAAGAAQAVDQVVPDFLPASVRKASLAILAIGVFLGFASPGARK